jgi:hypothetical protein
MRRLSELLFLVLFIGSAWAEEPPAAKRHAPRVTWEQHFAEANLAHDGHLTLEEAKGRYKSVAKHFNDIDADQKGYVTIDDLRAWRILRRPEHRAVPDKPKSQPARWTFPAATGSEPPRLLAVMPAAPFAPLR